MHRLREGIHALNDGEGVKTMHLTTMSYSEQAARGATVVIPPKANRKNPSCWIRSGMA